MNDCTCIGCGCADDDACDGGCSWLRLDEDAGVGVCSSCPEFVEAFDAGERGAGELLERQPGDLILPGDPDFHL